MRRLLALLPVIWLGTLVGCGASSSDPSSAPGYDEGGYADAGGYSPSDGGIWSDTGGSPTADAGGSFGGVGTGGAQDFAAFRKALDAGKIPDPSTLDAAGFFAEHFTSLPPPTCGKTFCLHGLLSVAPDLVRGGDWTLLQMAMNSPIDPATVKKPALDLAVVLDHSGSMAGSDKIAYARDGVKLLVDALGPEDRLTFVVFDDTVQTLFGPAPVTDKAAVKALVDKVGPAGGTNLYDGIEAGYKAIQASPEQTQRRVIFLTDGVATAGNTDPKAIAAMSASYNKKGLGLTTIGLGGDVNGPLLQGLAEKGGGNYYYVEKAAAVTEVFTEELAFFVAPIAYDLTLTLTEVPNYAVNKVYGSNLFEPVAGGGGGTIQIPSVFLVSRTSTKPGPTGGRRGGGSAILADLAAKTKLDAVAKHDVAKLSLRYRLPGTTTYETQDVTVTHDGIPGVAPEGGYYETDGVKKNTLVLSFFLAFQQASRAATDGKVKEAVDLLTAFKAKIEPKIATTDEDLVDDLKILDQFVAVLKKTAP